MSRSDHDSSTHLTSTSPSYSRPASKARSMVQDSFTNVKHTRVATLNALFLGETNIGESSIIDLIAGPREQKRTPPHSSRRILGNNVTLDGKTFTLYASPTNEFITPVALREGIQKTLTDLHRSGGIHLLVYCMNALHSTLRIHEIHRTIASYSTPFPRIPVVAVIAGMSDVAQQESWWSNNEGALADQGLHFDDHAFIRMMTTGAQSPTGDYISESRRALHALILQHCAYTPNSETGSDLQFRKSSPHTSTSPKAIDVILLGEIGVGKSSLINLIAKEDVARVSSDTIGCTETVAKYTFKEKGRTFHIHDTPGLVDPQMGIKPFVDPIDTTQKLIHSLGDGNGPDLLLFCIDNSRPTVALRRNYRLFCKIVCGGKVPFALVITKLEEGQDADQWWNQHRATIREYGIDCSGYVGFGREKKHSGPNANLEGMRESLLSFFVACTERQKNRQSSLRSSMGRMVSSFNSLLRPQASARERTLMKQCGLEEQTARELAHRIVPLKQSYGERVT